MKEKILIVIVLFIILASGFVYLKKDSQKVENPVSQKIQSNSEKVQTDQKGTIVSSREYANQKYLTDAKGMTLYVYADDKDLDSMCSGTCLNRWPVFEFDNTKSTSSSTDPLTQKLNIVKRKQDAYYQYAYGKKPLYYYVGDKNPGDMNGISKDAEGSKWSLVIVD